MASLIEDSIYEIICKHSYTFLKKKNVIGIGLGYKFIKGFDTGEPSLHILVKDKINLNNLYKNDRIEKSFFGIKTDVIKIGEFKESNSLKGLPLTPSKFQSKVRPIRAGYSISATKGKYAGTIGAVVFSNEKNKPCILSNNHVLTYNNTLGKGTSIIQPGGKDSKISSENKIAKVQKLIKLKFFNGLKITSVEDYPVNYVDCAIAKINSKIEYDTTIERIGVINNTIMPEVNMPIRKIGRSTAYTTGRIRTIKAIVLLSYANGDCFFKDQILATNMSKVGDSGALVLGKNNNVVGLLNGNSEDATFINPIDPVLKLLNIHF
ncbi:hypothetical protein [Clostridium tarantellae]|uniref:Serine protease n=1 Tax=Clostridium tarantellae TaxID=39493 RepID=A0A6I1MTX7_9CLOT|nr:hypothetical protein [Clostridium tarantellae]MPQ44321.1 hypothetical protein [Clostridium tarantellae]